MLVGTGLMTECKAGIDAIKVPAPKRPLQPSTMVSSVSGCGETSVRIWDSRNI